MTVAWSYSRLENFELCPKWFHAVFVAKTVREEKHPAALVGQDTHKAFQRAVVERLPLPKQLARFQPVITQFVAFPGEKLAEYQMAVNVNLQPVDWFAKDVYCRAIADFAAITQTKSLLVDYKTGKRKDDFTQLELTAALLMMHRPAVQEVNMRFLYTSDGALVEPPNGEAVRRESVPWILSRLEPRVRKYQEAHANHDFPPNPSWKCRNCVVVKCPYAEKR